MKISFITSNCEYRRCDCQRAVRVGLRELGHTVKVDRFESARLCIRDDAPDAMFVWNGVHGKREDAVRAFRKAKIPVWIMERGFFDRMRHTQIDAKGFNHRASWADTLCEPAPLEGRGRFEAVWGGPVTPMSARDSGYVLILGQTRNDAQLADSEISHPKQLIQAVAKALPTGIEARFRPHPLYQWNPRGCGADLCTAATLKEAVAGARFCVTINSNAGNEALAWGCPVLALGPALYTRGMVSAWCMLQVLGLSIRDMLDGWNVPPPERVANYLYNLACRQYGIAELRSGEALKGLGF